MTHLTPYEITLLRQMHQQSHTPLTIKAPERGEDGLYSVKVTQRGQPTDDLHELSLGQHEAKDSGELRHEVITLLRGLGAPSGKKTVYRAEIALDPQAPLSGYTLIESQISVPAHTPAATDCHADALGQRLSAQSVISASQARQYLTAYREQRTAPLRRSNSPWQHYFQSGIHSAHWVEVLDGSASTQALLFADPALTHLYLWSDDGQHTTLLRRTLAQADKTWIDTASGAASRLQLKPLCAAALPVISLQPQEQASPRRRPRLGRAPVAAAAASASLPW